MLQFDSLSVRLATFHLTPGDRTLIGTRRSQVFSSAPDGAQIAADQSCVTRVSSSLLYQG